MERCINCKHLFSRDICCFCDVDRQEINFPRLMGGSKKCQCYERRVKTKAKFKYPSKEE